MFKLDVELSTKYNEHGHTTELQKTSSFSAEILVDEEILMLKGKMKAMEALTKHINKKLKTNFQSYRIQYS